MVVKNYPYRGHRYEQTFVMAANPDLFVGLLGRDLYGSLRRQSQPAGCLMLGGGCDEGAGCRRSL